MNFPRYVDCMYDIIRNWERQQQLAANGGQLPDDLGPIQSKFDELIITMWNKYPHLESQFPLNTTSNVMEKLPMSNHDIQSITFFIKKMLMNTLIVEKQPPQVLKTNTRFAATVRLLTGAAFNITETSKVKVTLISEDQAAAIVKNNRLGQLKSFGEISNDSSSFEYHQPTKQFRVVFTNLILRKIVRGKTKAAQSVMDGKFALLFHCRMRIGCSDLFIPVWTLSLPVVVIVHGNQYPHAWATITWDNAFAEPKRSPFQVTEEVSWQHLAPVLMSKFKAFTGCSLSEDNLQYLGEKIFQSTGFLEPSAMVTWHQFCKKPLLEKNFTFWEWFYATMKVTRDHLKSLWMDGLIIGHIGRHQAEEMLLKKCNGTFLVRFTDSVPGGITIAFVGDSLTKKGQRDVSMLCPWTSTDFTIKPLVDMLYDFQYFQFLYPDIPKDQAFGKYYTPYTDDSNQNGYLRPTLVTHVPALPYLRDGFHNTLQSDLPSSDIGYHGPQSSDTQANLLSSSPDTPQSILSSSQSSNIQTNLHSSIPDTSQFTLQSSQSSNIQTNLHSSIPDTSQFTLPSSHSSIIQTNLHSSCPDTSQFTLPSSQSSNIQTNLQSSIPDTSQLTQSSNIHLPYLCNGSPNTLHSALPSSGFGHFGPQSSDIKPNLLSSSPDTSQSTLPSSQSSNIRKEIARMFIEL